MVQLHVIESLETPRQREAYARVKEKAWRRSARGNTRAAKRTPEKGLTDKIKTYLKANCLGKDHRQTNIEIGLALGLRKEQIASMTFRFSGKEVEPGVILCREKTEDLIAVWLEGGIA